MMKHVNNKGLETLVPLGEAFDIVHDSIKESESFPGAKIISKDFPPLNTPYFGVWVLDPMVSIVHIDEEEPSPLVGSPLPCMSPIVCHIPSYCETLKKFPLESFSRLAGVGTLISFSPPKNLEPSLIL